MNSYIRETAKGGTYHAPSDLSRSKKQRAASLTKQHLLFICSKQLDISLIGSTSPVIDCKEILLKRFYVSGERLQIWVYSIRPQNTNQRNR